MTNEPMTLKYRTGALPTRKPQRFRLETTPEQRKALAVELGLISLSALTMEGEIKAEGRGDFRLNARLVARADQSCVVTLAPVPAQIDQQITRRYTPDMAKPSEEEVEIPEDDSLEPLEDEIDVAAVAVEELVLALPPYPRAPGAVLGEAIHAEDGVEALSDADLRPFSGLQALKDKMNGGT
ncbi:DUF177 domain-containing protein [Falsirhodobacter sp. alg1]|uniref:YceD family protein n=1 Tax=Falsirhodobacter sp. alg1 TaxID=1472418 RepID=UPI00069350C5|nr:DUF177 domain-containing protein [Falsirhodobacter sp. alg1]